MAEQLPNVTLYYDANTLDSLTDCPVLNDTPYEYVPKHLPPTFQARATTAGKHWVKLRTIALYSVCTLGPAVVASRASAKQMFFGALDFGGAYPVTFLWGLAPPLIALSLRSVRNPGKFAFEGRKRRLIYVPLAIALSMMGYNVLGDATRILAGGVARWQ